MTARTYRAGTMKEALAQVRRDLGGDAVILATREGRPRRLFGRGTRELIEVTATDSTPGAGASSSSSSIRGWRSHASSPVPPPAAAPAPPPMTVAVPTGALQTQFGEQL